MKKIQLILFSVGLIAVIVGCSVLPQTAEGANDTALTRAAVTVTYQGESQAWTASDTASKSSKYVTLQANAVNDYFQFTQTPSAGTYSVTINYFKRSAYGIHQFSINGIGLGSPIDAYASGSSDTAASINLGNVTISGSTVFKFTVTGKNSSASDYDFRLDSVVLTAADGSPTATPGPATPTPTASPAPTATPTPSPVGATPSPTPTKTPTPTPVITGTPVPTTPATPSPTPAPGSNIPQNVMVPPMGLGNNGIAVIWSKPSDYSNVSGYNVYQNGSLVTTTTNLFYNAAGLASGTTYSYRVTAALKSGGESASSNTISATTTNGAVASVESFGAVGDGSTLNTTAIQAAIDAAPAGGIVLIPSGKTFVSGAIFLKSNMTLQVDGTLRGSDNAADYPKTSMRFPYYASGNNYMGLVNAYSSTYYAMTNVRIVGTGTINGSSDTVGSITGGGITKLGDAENSDDPDRGDLVTIKGVDGIFIGGNLTLVNPAMHTIFCSFSRNITVNGIHANTYDIHNADGIDLATSDTAYIYNSTFDTGDDCINFNAGVGAGGVADNYPDTNIRVFNCTTNHGHGAVVAGSFTAAWIQNVLVEDCVFNNTEIGIRMKTGTKQGGGARNWVVRDIVINGTSKDAGLFFDSTYSSDYPSAGAGQFHDIVCYNITINNPKTYGIYVNGISGTPHTGLSFKNITISGSGKGVSLNYCTNSSFDSVNITTATPWTYKSGLTGITFANCTPTQTNIP